MPWREYARDWQQNLLDSFDASFLGVERKNGFVVLEINRDLPPDQDLRVTFPCGHALRGHPIWQRKPSSSEHFRIGFFSHELGMSAKISSNFRRLMTRVESPELRCATGRAW